MKLENECCIVNVRYTSCKENVNKYKYSNVVLSTCILNANEEYMKKLLKFSRDCKLKLTLEVEEPILDEVEKKYLSGVIRPFRNEVKHIKKIEYTESEYIQITLKSFDSSCINLPFFKKGTMYKNMKSYKEYKLKELGL